MNEKTEKSIDNYFKVRKALKNYSYLNGYSVECFCFKDANRRFIWGGGYCGENEGDIAKFILNEIKDYTFNKENPIYIISDKLSEDVINNVYNSLVKKRNDITFKLKKI